MNRLVILAPNWLGDAVMALPAIADVRRAAPDAFIAVAARPAIAPLFPLVPGVNETIVLKRRAALHDVGSWRGLGEDLAGGQFDTALLFPNSVHAALVVSRAGIRERWGYRRSGRALLLTRAIAPPSGRHQVDDYRHLVQALGFPNGPIEPALPVSPAVRARGADALTRAGWDGRTPLAALAPGAAYGGAKRWSPESFAELARQLSSDGIACVLVGAAADAETTARVARGAPRAMVYDMAGTTDLPALAGVLAHCRSMITNDSGAMHVAAAIGIPVTAVFGPTDDRATRPMGPAHAVVTNPVWCRPCMLRECPLDHACMRGVAVTDVLAQARRNF